MPRSPGEAAACSPGRPATLAAALQPRNSHNSSTSTSSRGCGWGQPGGLHHDWTSRGAGLPPAALRAASQSHVGWAWVGGGGRPGSVVLAPGPSPQPGSHRPKGEVGAGCARFPLGPTLAAEGACTAAAGTRLGRQEVLLRRSGGRPAPGAPDQLGSGAQRLPCALQGEWLPDPKGWGWGRTGCPASAPPHQAGGVAGDAETGVLPAPPLSNHFPRL